ncbi:MAG: hypothetical protein R3E83_01390 [Burkholderiaceae bacterium]
MTNPFAPPCYSQFQWRPLFAFSAQTDEAPFNNALEEERMGRPAPYDGRGDLAKQTLDAS